ncbi:MAG: hypothetical protein LW768_06895 [Rubrivivax sp.]|jgi:hypothetical protein|nr:hypothetical protein [Rubrivivax sp.]
MKPATDRIPMPDFLHPSGRPALLPRLAWVALGACVLVFAVAAWDSLVALQQRDDAAQRLAIWQTQQTRQARLAPLGATAPPANSAATTPSRSGAPRTAADPNARRQAAAWTVQAQLDHPWARMSSQLGLAVSGLALAPPATGLQWIAIEHSLPTTTSPTAPRVALWRLQGRVQQSRDALLIADTLASTGPWQSVQLNRLEPLTAGRGQAADGWRFDLSAQWPLDPGVPSR